LLPRQQDAVLGELGVALAVLGGQGGQRERGWRQERAIKFRPGGDRRRRDQADGGLLQQEAGIGQPAVILYRGRGL
jgi:hypothetical protein